MKKKKNSFIVPLVFSLSDYQKETPLYLWIYELYMNYTIRNDSAMISQEFYFNHEINILGDNYWGGVKNDLAKKELNNLKKKFLKYSIRNPETEQFIEDKKTVFQVETDFLTSKNKELISIIEDRMDKIEKDYSRKIDALMVWVSNPSLEEIAKKRKIKIISQELSPIRNIPNNKNYNTTLCYFQFKNKYDKDYVKLLFNNFKESIKKEDIQIFSREELLSIFLNTEDLWLLNKIKDPPQYELGVSPGFQNDAFFEAYSNEKIEETCKKIDQLFPPSRVSIRYHPNLEYTVGNKLWHKDTSNKSIYWVSKCQRVVTSVSNIGFDAMMFGRTCYTLTENMPFSFKSVNRLDWKDESVVDSLYLNFMLFGIFTHWNLFLDQKYMDWRMSDPNIFEVFKYNREYVLKHLNLDITKNRLTQRDILQQVHKIDEKDIEKIVNYNLFDRIKSIENENSRLKNENSELKTQNNELNNENNNLKNENDTLKNQNSELNNENDNLKNENDTLKNQNNELNNENNNLKNENDTLKNQNSELNNENDNLKNENDMLKKENNKLKNSYELKVKEIQRIYTSKSWKLTKPLRKIAKYVRNFTNKNNEI